MNLKHFAVVYIVFLLLVYGLMAIFPGLNFWFSMIIVFPFLFIFYVCYLIIINYSTEKKLVNIPVNRFPGRIKSMNSESEKIIQLDFIRFDTYWTDTVPDLISYAFRHKTEPCILVLSDNGTANKYISIITYFKEKCLLVTGSALNMAKIPPYHGTMLQVQHKASCEKLLEEHGKSLDFLKNKGLNVLEIPYDEFRDRMEKGFEKQRKHLTGKSFWFLRILYMSFLNDAGSYGRSIEEQYKSGRYKFLDEIDIKDSEKAND